LFFDLAFVFTLTQLTTVLFDAPNGRGLLRVVAKWLDVGSVAGGAWLR
jgi:low temperature requirement protein LtrA